MKNQSVLLFVFVSGYALLLISCEFFNRRKNIASEHTRKFAHFVSTLSVLLFPYIFKDEGYVLAICAIFFVALLMANRMRLLHSIDGVGRKTGGSYLLSLSVGITYYISVRLGNNELYTLSILILAICDPLASIVGQWVGSKHILHGKTIAGTFIFLLSALLINLFFLFVTHHESVVILSFLVAFTATLAELLSPRGTDNLTIPMAVTSVLILYL